MSTVSLSSSAAHINTMWSGMTGYNYSSNMSLLASENTVGLNSSLPSLTQFNNPPFYSQSALTGFNHGVYDERAPNECARTLQTEIDLGSTLANTHVIMYDSNYVIRALTANTTTVYKNNASVGTISGAGSTLSLSSLVIGDIITFNYPAVIYNATYPGSQGTYGGYAGYCFATRRDRYTKYIRISNLTKTGCKYQILYTATGDANVTSLTSVAASDISAGETISYGAFTTTGQYFIQTDGLCVAWAGEPPTKDCLMLYPMTAETKYGFFSSDGHVFATNNAEAQRQNTGGGQTIAGRTTDGDTANIITSLGTGKDQAYGCTGVSSTIKSGNYFSGEACAVFAQSSEASEAGTIFTAESQADGNGGEMTSFTAASAHARGACSGGGAAWVAVVGAGFSGSTPSYPLYADVIMRFNSSGVFQDAESFTGSALSPPVKKAYWGNGAGSGTYFNAGDYFISTVAVQGYQDTDSSDKDETNMVMTNNVLLPDEVQYTIYGEEVYLGFETASLACTEEGSSWEVLSPSSAMQNGMVMFDIDSTSFETPFNGENLYFRYVDGRTSYSFTISYNGIVSELTLCT